MRGLGHLLSPVLLLGMWPRYITTCVMKAAEWWCSKTYMSGVKLVTYVCCASTVLYRLFIILMLFNVLA